MMSYVEEFEGKMTVEEMKEDIISIVGEKCDWINLDDTPEEDVNEYYPDLSNDELDEEIDSHMKWQNEKFGLDVNEDSLFEKKVLFDAPNADLYVVVYSSAEIDFIVQVILSSDGEFDEFKLTSRNIKDKYELVLEKLESEFD